MNSRLFVNTNWESNLKHTTDAEKSDDYPCSIWCWVLMLRMHGETFATTKRKHTIRYCKFKHYTLNMLCQYSHWIPFLPHTIIYLCFVFAFLFSFEWKIKKEIDGNKRKFIDKLWTIRRHYFKMMFKIDEERENVKCENKFYS